MASILQHQVESKVNDLYYKMQRHAQIIMKLSVELDKMKGENEELKSMVNQDRQIIKKLYHNQNSRNEMDIQTKHSSESNERGDIMNEYNNYDSQDNSRMNQ